MGIERGLAFVADKVEQVADKVDWLITQVDFIMNLTQSFTEAGDFADIAVAFFEKKLKQITNFLGGKMLSAGAPYLMFLRCSHCHFCCSNNLWSSFVWRSWAQQ